jgi:hypothetical protein
MDLIFSMASSVTATAGPPSARYPPRAASRPSCAATCLTDTSDVSKRIAQRRAIRESETGHGQRAGCRAAQANGQEASGETPAGSTSSMYFIRAKGRCAES